MQQGDFTDNIPPIEQLLEHPMLQGALQLPPHYFVYVYDMRAQRYVFVSDQAEPVMGIPKKEMLRDGIAAVFNRLTPEDRLIIQNAVLRRMHFTQTRTDLDLRTAKFNAMFRMRKDNDKVAVLYHQSFPLYVDERGNAAYMLCIDSEMPFAPTGKLPQCVLTYQDKNGRYHHEDLGEEENLDGKRITRRELEVLRLLVQGKNSQQIADEIQLSTHTINKHRQNLLSKSRCKNTAELIEFSFRMGWL
jgi:DNA-binding CsgD family transcriptional regulator